MENAINIPGLFKRARSQQATGGATDAAIARAEMELGVTLPAEFKSVLRYRDGGDLRLNQFELAFDPPADSYASKLYCVDELPSVRHGDWGNIVRSTENAQEEWDLPAGLVVLCGGGHWWCCLDYRTCGPTGQPAITHIDVADDPEDAPREIPIAPSFALLLSGLRQSPDSVKPAVITLNAESTTVDQLDGILVHFGLRRVEQAGKDTSTSKPPPVWEWTKYNSFVSGRPARVELWTNEFYHRLPLYSEKHAMLQVFIELSNERACLEELLAALGTQAVLLHGLE
jgi:hypothetical protein